MTRRVVAITGAGGTLGAALSSRFAGEPDTDVVLSDVSVDALAASVAGLPADRGTVETLAADVSDFDAVEHNVTSQSGPQRFASKNIGCDLSFSAGCVPGAAR